MRTATRRTYPEHLTADLMGEPSPRDREELLLLLGKTEQDYYDDRRAAQAIVDRVQLLEVAQGILTELRSLREAVEGLRGNLTGPPSRATH